MHILRTNVAGKLHRRFPTERFRQLSSQWLQTIRDWLVSIRYFPSPLGIVPAEVIY